MELTSLTFLIFLLIFLFLYYVFPPKLRTIPLIIGSSIFIITLDIGLFFFLILYVLINFFLIAVLNNSSGKTLRKIALVLALIINISTLCFFKYLPFILNNTNRFLSLFHQNLSAAASLNLILPIGMSFFVFKSISLIIDTYKNQQSDFNLGSYLSYITFFPEFLSGPIDRFSNFYHSLTNQNKFSASCFFSGLYRFLLGLFKKLIIANNIALLIKPVYENPPQFNSLNLLTATYLFSLQIFLDFSGYSDMAIGIGKMLGFSVPENFNQPYLANSIKEFWRRWHITLSSWFRDYLYIPLGGNRKGLLRQIINILIVFLITGLWHGASWNFVCWGLIHGLYQTISLIFPTIPLIEKLNFKLKTFLNIFLTFNLVNFAWIFFRAKSLKHALSFIRLIFSYKPNSTSLDLITISIPFMLLLILYFLLYLSSKNQHRSLLLKIITIGFVVSSLLFYPASEPQDFLYFKF